MGFIQNNIKKRISSHPCGEYGESYLAIGYRIGKMGKQTLKRTPLKNARTTRKQSRSFFAQLYEKYPSCVHDHIEHHKYANQKIIYGEMEYEGMRDLYAYVRKLEPELGGFMDIGSGRGKLCLFMAEFPEITYAIGIELVRERCRDAQKLKRDLRGEFGSITKKVRFLCKNALEIDYRTLVPRKSSPCFVWFSNLCFVSETSDLILRKLSAELPRGSIVACSQALSAETREEDGIQKFGNISVAMSWNTSSNVHVYRSMGT